MRDRSTCTLQIAPLLAHRGVRPPPACRHSRPAGQHHTGEPGLPRRCHRRSAAARQLRVLSDSLSLQPSSRRGSGTLVRRALGANPRRCALHACREMHRPIALEMTVNGGMGMSGFVTRTNGASVAQKQVNGQGASSAIWVDHCAHQRNLACRRAQCARALLPGAHRVAHLFDHGAHGFPGDAVVGGSG